MNKLSVPTSSEQDLVDITRLVAKEIENSGVASGVCHIFSPHTTCALAINENYDPDVKKDVLAKLNETISTDFPYRHSEGNSPAHIKSMLVGPSLTVFIENSSLQLGTWQGIFLCEFDGPRDRQIWVKVVKDRT